MTKLNFTREQRLLISLLCDIHREKDKRQFTEDDINLISGAVANGHDWAIEWEMGSMFPEEVSSEADVSFVADVLDMWEFIELGWSKLTPEEKKQVHDAVPYLGEGPSFIGFDGNNEGNYFGIARTMVKDLERFGTFEGRSLNSHSPKVERYRDMLEAWPGVRKTLHQGAMTPNQLIELLKRD